MQIKEMSKQSFSFHVHKIRLLLLKKVNCITPTGFFVCALYCNFSLQSSAMQYITIKRAGAGRAQRGWEWAVKADGARYEMESEPHPGNIAHIIKDRERAFDPHEGGRAAIYVLFAHTTHHPLCSLERE